MKLKYFCISISAWSKRYVDHNQRITSDSI